MGGEEVGGNRRVEEEERTVVGRVGVFFPPYLLLFVLSWPEGVQFL